MSNYYKQKIVIPGIIKMLEMGITNQYRIAREFEVTISFVRSIIEGYDMFYVN